MRTIKPAEISGKIISLIDEADKELVVISPCSMFDCRVFARLKKAIDRGVKISFFVGKDAVPPQRLNDLSVQVYYVDKLHAKIFLNEKQAILTSMNVAEASEKFSIDFGVETESSEEFEEVKRTYLSFIQKNVASDTYTTGSYKKSGFRNPYFETGRHSQGLACTLSKKMQLFEAHFQKTFRRYNLVYNKHKDTIVCNSFPFEWTNFEYSGSSIKITFLLASTFDYCKFRNENFDEFNDLFRNHKAYWSYPYDTIRIYGDEASNGINNEDVKAQIAYMLFLIKEVTRFFEAKEEVLLKTPLYRCIKHSVYSSF